MDGNNPPMITVEDILALEQNSRDKGSSIVADRLEAVWSSTNTWTRKGERPAPGTDPLLRILDAQLRLERSDDLWQITNQVKLGSLRLRFQGEAILKGPRPLLMFHFQTVELLLGDRTLLKRCIAKPPRQRMPFFALIAMAPAGEWLTARGRGGGLALWTRYL